MPVTSFAPEFLEFYRQASQKTKTIKLKNAKLANKLRGRLHSLRRQMRNENHPMTNLANGVIIELIENEDGSALLIAHPADTIYLSALAEAGITISNEATTSTTELQVEPNDEDTESDETLGQFFRGENKT